MSESSSSHLSVRQPSSGEIVSSQESILAQLVPEKIIRVYDKTIYTFLRSGGKTLGQLKMDRSLPREAAMMIFPRGRETFTLSYYPLEGDAQFVKELPMSDLRKAVDDLVQAGFPHRRIVAASKPTPVSETQCIANSVDSIQISSS